MGGLINGRTTVVSLWQGAIQVAENGTSRTDKLQQSASCSAQQPTARARCFVQSFVWNVFFLPVAMFAENKHDTFPIPQPEHMYHVSNKRTQDQDTHIHTGLLTSPRGTKHVSGFAVTLS